MTNLNKVTMLMEEYRDLLRSQTGDHVGGATLTELVTHGASKRYGEDVIVNTAVALHSIYGKERLSTNILEDAVTLLDYWGTLGMKVEYKK